MKAHQFARAIFVGIAPTDLDQEGWHQIDQLVQNRRNFNSLEEASDHLLQADCLIVRLGINVTKEIIDACPALRYIGVFSTSTTNIDLDYAKLRGIIVQPTRGYSTNAVAEWTMAALLAHMRELHKALEHVRAGRYSNTGFLGMELSDKKFGVLGLGDIGSRVAKLAAGFGTDVTYWSRTRKCDRETASISYASLTSVLSSSDILSLNFAITKDTQEFMDAKKLELIKPHAIVVSTIPISAFDVDALVNRLQRKNLTLITMVSPHITPDQITTLRHFEGFILYPAITYLTPEALAARQKEFISNLKNALSL